MFSRWSLVLPWELHLPVLCVRGLCSATGRGYILQAAAEGKQVLSSQSAALQEQLFLCSLVSVNYASLSHMNHEE